MFGYAAGWNPYASDYTRYLPPDAIKARRGCGPALGVFVSCIVLEIVGAASATAAPRTPRSATRPAPSPATCRRVGRPDPAGHRARRGRGQRAEHLLRRDVVHCAWASSCRARGAGRSSPSSFGVLGFIVAHRPNDAHQVRELPADHRLLDRPWLGVCSWTSSAPAAPGRGLLFDEVRELGGSDRDAGRHGRVDPAVLQPDRVHRRGARACRRRSATSPSRSASSITAVVYLSWHGIERRAAAPNPGSARWPNRGHQRVTASVKSRPRG